MVIKKNKRRLVTPASGSPEVDQGLTKRSLNMQVQNAVKQPQSVKAVVKTIKRKSINCQQVNVYQSRRKNNHTRQSSLRSWHNSIRREVI
jgi:uncharacterized protein (DUF111 family)